MALGHAHTVSLLGVTGTVIAVEADIAQGMPGITVVGMGDTAVAQARDRVRAAVVNSGFTWPGTRITVSLAPAGIHKRGAAFDLAIAAALMIAQGDLPTGAADGLIVLGELGLDGAVRSVAGVLPSLLAARDEGFTDAVVPLGNLPEASLAGGMTVRGVGHRTRSGATSPRGPGGRDTAAPTGTVEQRRRLSRYGRCAGPGRRPLRPGTGGGRRAPYRHDRASRCR